MTERGAQPARPLVWLVGSEDARFRIPLAHELGRRGFDVHIAGTEAEAPFVEAGIPYHRYPMARTLSPVGDARAYRALLSAFRRHRPDVVNAFDTKPGILATIAARRAGVPCRVRTVTGLAFVFSSSSPEALALRPVYHVVQPLVSRAASMTVFQNTDDRAYYLEHRLARPETSTLIRGSGIDIEGLRRAAPRSDELGAVRTQLGVDGGPVVTMISRLVREKGVSEFCAAARIVRERRPDCTFLLVGPLASEGRQAVDRLEVTENPDVNWTGPRDDVPALLALSDVFVLPSYYREGVPRSLLEAAAMGLPLVTTGMPGCRDVVEDGWNGAIVPTRDAGAVADRVLELLDDPKLRATMGERSAVRVEEQFSLRIVADAYASLYGSLLAPG